MSQKKLIYFSDDQIARIQKDAEDREISFTEMVRRILDRHYENQPNIIPKPAPHPSLVIMPQRKSQ